MSVKASVHVTSRFHANQLYQVAPRGSRSLRQLTIATKMPTTRRSQAKATGPAARGAQSRLSFGSRSKITKPSLPAQVKKKDPALIEAVTRTPTPECASTVKADEVVQEQPKSETAKPHKTREKEDAATLSEAHVKRYWMTIENERKAPRGS
ncbi:hypothetical protein GP486_001189 [Trichoglossum hirsutum]|uniref:Uncharacterized protein n=1 Tax=Trichoglossum hirsutum TaxID=265104 RepID=A0A9P8RTC0_9PEZI|nr:hypothetical protein GP486_001189 [Trichoglossum hirsutum]